MQVEAGEVVAEQRLTVEDHVNGYFTSAVINGTGILIGDTAYLEMTTHIENDVQRRVAVWTLTSRPLFSDQVTYKPCQG